MLERQIFKRIVNLAMCAAWGFGIPLVLTPGTMSWTAPWWLAKFAAVLGLSWFHGTLSAWRRRFRDGKGPGAAALRHGLAVPLALGAIAVAMVMIHP